MVDFDLPSILILTSTFMVVLGLCSGADPSQFKEYIKKPKGVLISLLCQFILLPGIAFSISKIFNLSRIESIGLIVTGSSPGGTSSNFWCFFFGSDLELSIACTSASSILSFIFLTVNVLFYVNTLTTNSGSFDINDPNNIQIDYINMAISIVIVIFGIFIGVFVSYKNILCLKKIVSVLGVFGYIIGLTIAIFLNGDSTQGTPFYKLETSTWISTLILNLSAWILSFVISKLFCLLNNQAFTISIECSFQNVGLAAAILYVSLDSNQTATAIGIPLMYGSCSIVITICLGSIFYCFGVIKQPSNLEEEIFKNLNYGKASGILFIKYYLCKKICQRKYQDMNISKQIIPDKDNENDNEHSNTNNLNIPKHNNKLRINNHSNTNNEIDKDIEIKTKDSNENEIEIHNI